MKEVKQMEKMLEQDVLDAIHVLQDMDVEAEAEEFGPLISTVSNNNCC